MTTVRIGDHLLLVDVEQTKAYYQARAQTLCECPCCRNYYALIQSKYPRLEQFLAQFGVDVSRPDEALSVEMSDWIDYINVDYTVCGTMPDAEEITMERQGDFDFDVVFFNGFVSPNAQTGEYFTISVSGIDLPWGLDEPFPAPIRFKKESKLIGLLRRWFGL